MQSRRSFIKSASLLTVPAFIPNLRAASPNGKVRHASIGCGGQAWSDLGSFAGHKDFELVAVADVDVKNHAQAKQRWPEVRCYQSWRELLEKEKDLDSVNVSIPDHMHGIVTVSALNRGLHTYTQKPLAQNIWECRQLMLKAREKKAITQMGIQISSEFTERHAVDYIQSGVIGKIKEVHTFSSKTWGDPNPVPAQTDPVPETLDWDAWLGPCPWRPYNHSYVRGGWRGVRDFHTSCIGEWGAHTFAQAQVGIGCGETSPVAYEYVDNETGDGLTCHFSNGVKMVLSRGDKYWRGSCGERFDGSEGWAAAADGYTRPELSNPAMLAEFNKVVGDYVARTGRALNHMRNFLDCVKSREQTVANPRVMHHSMTAVHGANICMWLKRNLRYDPVKERFIGDDEANRFLSRAMREPYIY